MYKKIIAISLATLLCVGTTSMTSHAESTFNFNFSYSSAVQYSAKGYVNNLATSVSVNDNNLSSTKRINVNMVDTNYSSISDVKNLTKSGVRWLLPKQGYAYLKGAPNATGVYANGYWTTP